MVKLVPAAHAIATVATCPEAPTVPGVHVPAVAVTNPAVPDVVLGAVHPVGAVNVTSEPAPNDVVAGAVKVKVKTLPEELCTAVVGETVIVPFPLAAAATTLTVGDEVIVVSVPPVPCRVCVVN